MEDARIIELYFARDEAAIEQTRISYGHKLRSLARRILADDRDAQECENDTYLKTWTSIPPNRPTHFFAYLAKICRNAALSLLEYRGAAKRSAQVVELTDEMQQCIPDRLAEQAFEPEEIGKLLNAFLRDQSEDNRRIFVRRYFSGESVAEIAQALGFSESKVKSALLRTREKLRIVLEKEGVKL